MFEVNVKNVTEGRRRRRRGPAQVWGSDCATVFVSRPNNSNTMKVKLQTYAYSGNLIKPNDHMS